MIMYLRFCQCLKGHHFKKFFWDVWEYRSNDIRFWKWLWEFFWKKSETGIHNVDSTFMSYDLVSDLKDVSSHSWQISWLLGTQNWSPHHWGAGAGELLCLGLGGGGLVWQNWTSFTFLHFFHNLQFSLSPGFFTSSWRQHTCWISRGGHQRNLWWTWPQVQFSPPDPPGCSCVSRRGQLLPCMYVDIHIFHMLLFNNWCQQLIYFKRG